VLFAVKLQVRIPPDLDPQVRADLIAREKVYSQELQRSGKWPHLWRCAGQYASLSIFDVADAEELNTIMFGLPLFPYMEVEVTALATHPSDINAS
jgi:muconolactone D-isomerase